MCLRTLHLALAWLAVSTGMSAAVDRYVSTGGLDTNPGTFAQPWRTIQKAAGLVVAGDTVFIRGNGGVYAERVSISARDGTLASPIVFKTYPGDPSAIIETTIVATETGNISLLTLQNSDYVTIENIEFRNCKTFGTNPQQRQQLPAGIYITGNGAGISIRGCKVHDIWQSNTVLNSFMSNGFGIAVYGNSATAIDGLVLDGNEIYNLRTGASESVVLNGNVTNFKVTNNLVHDCNNIGIDFIGYEGTNSNIALDRARNGLCAGNSAWNIDSAFNPAYGGNFTTGGGDRSAAGIYVDGGTNIVIERNHVFRCNFGIELASEVAAGFTDYITLRNNLLHHNHVTGIIMGGYDRLRGQTRFCTITGNTLYRNDTDVTSTGQIALQFYVSDCAFRNNIVWADSTTKQLWLHYPGDNLATTAQKEIGANVTLDYNRYFCSVGSATNLEFGLFKNGLQRYFTTLTSWKTDANGLLADANSTFGNPGFEGATPADPPAAPTLADLANIRASYRLLAAAAAVNAGDPGFIPATAEKDLGGQSRVAGGRVDIGADEYMTAWQSWRDQFFALPDGGTGAGSADDPDFDGAKNVLEYSQGTNPTFSDAALMPSASRSGNALRFTYRKAAGELTYAVDTSTNLTSWTPTAVSEQTDGLGLFWRDFPLTGPPLFIKLRVVQP